MLSALLYFANKGWNIHRINPVDHGDTLLMNKKFFNAVQEVFNSLGPLTPAFKTNLEIPVKAQLTIPIQILK